MNEYTDSEYVEVCPCSSVSSSFSSRKVLIHYKCLKLLEKGSRYTEDPIHFWLLPQ